MLAPKGKCMLRLASMYKLMHIYACVRVRMYSHLLQRQESCTKNKK
jgi:hypothetical protein